MHIKQNLLLGLTSLGLLGTALESNAQFVTQDSKGCKSGTHTYTVGVAQNTHESDAGVVQMLSTGDSFKIVDVKTVTPYNFGSVDLTSLGGRVMTVTGNDPLKGGDVPGYYAESGELADNISKPGQLTATLLNEQQKVITGAAVPVSRIQQQVQAIGEHGGVLSFTDNLRSLDGQKGASKIKVEVKCAQ